MTTVPQLHTRRLEPKTARRAKGGTIAVVRISPRDVDEPSRVSTGGSRRGGQWAIRGRLRRMHHLSHRHIDASGQLGGDSLIRLILRTSQGRLTRSSRCSPPPPHLRIFPSACRREGHRVIRISTNEQNQATTSRSHRGAHSAVKAIEAVLCETAGWAHPRVGRRVISHGGHFFLKTTMPSRELRHPL